MEKIQTDGWEGTIIDDISEVEKDAYVEILVERPETIEQYSDQMSELVYELFDLRSGLLAIELDLTSMRAEAIGISRAFFRVTDDPETKKLIRRNRGVLFFSPSDCLNGKSAIERLSIIDSNRISVLSPYI